MTGKRLTHTHTRVSYRIFFAGKGMKTCKGRMLASVHLLGVCRLILEMFKGDSVVIP